MGMKISPRTWTQSSFLYQFQTVQGSVRTEKSFLVEILGISLICFAMAGEGMSYSSDDAAEGAIERSSIDASLSLQSLAEDEEGEEREADGMVSVMVVVVVEEEVVFGEDLVVRLVGDVRVPISILL